MGKSKRRKAAPIVRHWTPLQPATRLPPKPDHVKAMRVKAADMGLDPDAAVALMYEDHEVWRNNVYQVIVRRHPDGWVERLSIRRDDRAGEPFPWRDLQRIKTQLAGAEAEAVELFPAESRLVDTANQRWLWCFPPGHTVPIGFTDGRHVGGPEDAAAVGAKQEPLLETP
jgi:hypothetical protein